MDGSSSSDTAGGRATMPPSADVVVVGGGLAGLTAAATAARSGASVVLVEAREALGGRARSDSVEGFVVNHGAHALYRAGRGTRILRELGVTPKGHLPKQGGAAWWIDHRRVPVRRTSVAGGRQGIQAARRLVFPGARGNDAGGRSMESWMDENIPAAGRPLAEMLLRTTCYCADFSDVDAGAALAQISSAVRGVHYLDGGWQSLVDGLRDVGRAAGVVSVEGRVESVRVDGSGVVVGLRNGRSTAARSAILATGGPSQVDAVLGGASPTVAAWAADAAPIVAACLDVAVAGSARGRPVSTYGLGTPLYAVDHARSAELAPDGGAMHHALFYEPDRAPDVDHRAVLEEMLDAQDAGWRDRAISVTYRKRSVVAHDRVRPMRGASRPTVRVPDVEGVFVAGDWLTGHGMLADAPVSSGAEAGRAAAALAAGRLGALHAGVGGGASSP